MGERQTRGGQDRPQGAPLVVWLHDPAARDRRLVGGKAASLASLVAFGAAVPPGFCVTTGAFDAVREAAEDGLGEAVGREVRDAYRKLVAGGGHRVAVRSSAAAEDRADASFAGQYLTCLGVAGWDAVQAAIRECWSSLSAERAVAYRRGVGDPGESGSIAVVVQRQIDADVAGVAFSRDPASGGNAVVVDASWGMGEAVVSGWVTPDHFRVGPDGTIDERRISRKHVRSAPSHPGIKSEVEEEMAGAACLTDEQLRRLAEEVRRVERASSAPVDVEFAVTGDDLWLVQSRPITTIAPEPLLPGADAPPANAHWTRAIADEYWADGVTPLSFSSLGDWIDGETLKAMNRIAGLQSIDPAVPIVRLHRSHVYWNADAVAAGFAYLPPSARVKNLMDYLPPVLREDAKSVPMRWGGRLRGELLMRLRDRDSSIRRNHRALADHARRVERACADLDRVDLERASAEELDRYWAALDRLGRSHFRLIRWGMQNHSLSLSFALRRLLAAWLGDDGGLFATLIGSTDGNLTLVVNRDLWRLATLAEREPRVVDLLRGVPPPAVSVGVDPENPGSTAVAERRNESPFAREFANFLERYGHRGFTRDIAVPRWGDNPDAVLYLVVEALGMPDDPEKRTSAERARRASAEREARARLGRGPRGAARRLAFDTVLRYARIYAGFRENQRFTLDRVLARARRGALAYGRLLAGRDRIPDAGAIFFLTIDEIGEALDGGVGDPARLADARRRAFLADRDRLPPKYLRGDVPLGDEVTGGDCGRVEAEDVMRGMAVSPGRVMGRCRVVRTLADAGGLASGDILVTSNVDPASTPILVRAGGLVLQTGGVLAHGAIVAREYGIPAVTAVEGAVERIRDGEWLTVDGWSGTVLRHGDSPPAEAEAKVKKMSEEMT